MCEHAPPQVLPEPRMTEGIRPPELTAVKATMLPYDQWFDWYQEYYRYGIARYLEGSPARVSTTPDPVPHPATRGS